MTTGQKIYDCRRKAGMTQEELADRLGVSRQAVSKWEADAAFPETEKILELCKLFGVSADELLFGKEQAEERIREDASPREEKTWGVIHAGNWRYEYISKTRICGIPLVHIHFGFAKCRAKGIIAIGNVATGLVSFGFLSLGLISFGILAIGLFAFGSLALGLLFGAGGVATGCFAFGGVAIGVLSFGGLAVGYCAVGGMAVGQFALGDWAQGGWLAVGVTNASGTHAFYVPEMLNELGEFLDENASVWLGDFIRTVASFLNKGTA